MVVGDVISPDGVVRGPVGMCARPVQPWAVELVLGVVPRAEAATDRALFDKRRALRRRRPPVNVALERRDGMSVGIRRRLG